MGIACVEGIEPFIELSHWVAWVVQNWVALTQSFWRALGSWIGLNVPPNVADGLSAVTYTISLFMGYVRLDSTLANKLMAPAKWAENLVTRTKSKLVSLIYFAFASVLLISPYFTVFTLIILKSTTQGVIFGGLFVLLYCMAIFSPKLRNFFDRLLTKGKEKDAAYGEEELYVLDAILTVPVIILLFFTFILALNEISLSADNIMALYNWARCDAGIEC